MIFLRQASAPGNLLIALTLALAGCGGGNSDSSADTVDSGTNTARQESSTQQHPAAGHVGKHNSIRPVGEPTGDPRPGADIQNPIFADPLPVPVPEGEGPDLSSGARPGDSNQSDKNQAGKTPETTQKPPRPNDPEPVAERPSLHWDSPMTREDGSKLFPGEISGYKVYYRLLHQKNYKSVEVEGADIDELALKNFGPGVYEFAVSTIDTSGIESRRSEPVQVDLI